MSESDRIAYEDYLAKTNAGSSLKDYRTLYQNENRRRIEAEAQLTAATQAREKSEQSYLELRDRALRCEADLRERIDALTAANAGLVELLEEACPHLSTSQSWRLRQKIQQALAAQQEGGKPVVCPFCMGGAVKHGPKSDRARCLYCKSEWEIRHGRRVITQEQIKKMDCPWPQEDDL